MKAIVMIDMPTKCGKCLFVEEWFNEYGEQIYYCSLHRTSVSKNGDVCKEVKPLPQELERLLEGEKKMTKTEALESWKKLLEEIDKDNWLFVGTINPQMVEIAISSLQKDLGETE